MIGALAMVGHLVAGWVEGALRKGRRRAEARRLSRRYGIREAEVKALLDLLDDDEPLVTPAEATIRVAMQMGCSPVEAHHRLDAIAEDLTCASFARLKDPNEWN